MLTDDQIWQLVSTKEGEYERFIEAMALVRQAERERCAEVVAEHTAEDEQGWLNLFEATYERPTADSTD